MDVRIKLLPGGTLPTFGSYGAAALDVYARQSGTIEVGKRHKIPLGFAIEIPEGYVGLVTGRSGLAAKSGIDLFGGVIDPDYRGECHAILFNSNNEPFGYAAGERVAQMLIVACLRPRLQVADDLSETERGGYGFGSTGK